jgi:hypothetical protein
MNQGRGKKQNPLLSSMLSAIRRELRKWYGLISVDELVNNRDLVFEIEVLERMLAREGS